MTTPDLVDPLVSEDSQPRRGQFRLFADAFLANRLAVLGLVLVLLAVFAGLTADWIAPQDPNAQNLSRRLEPPSADYLLGTDQYGRDLLSRILHGTQVSWPSGFSALSSRPASVCFSAASPAIWVASSTIS